MMAGASSPMGFSYSGADPAAIQTRLSQMQQSGFDTQPNAGEIFSLTTGMDLIGFSNQSDVVSWQHQNQNDDPSLRCVFPCGANERPSQGLSLSLSSTDPSGIGLQSFELRPTQHQHQHQNDDDHMRFLTRNNGFFFGEGLLGKQVNFQLRNSTYLAPAKELLNEFCSLETTSHQADQAKKQHRKNKETEVDNSGTGSTSNQSSSSPSSLYALDIIELQKRKAKLLSMLEEVDRRYRHYCDQMKAVVSSFEAAAGAGAARVYSALAAKAMSRHFRSLRDGIVGQIQATKKAMGEKDPAATPGASRGETPRLRLLDQTLRQQRAFQQMAVMESHPWRPQRGLPERSVSVLRAWLFEHFLHPYPSDVDKHILARQTGLSRSQVSNWFINARVRLWKPMVEEMYVEETKEQDNLNNNNNMGCSSETGPDRPNWHEDHKPTADQLVRIDSECLSSIVTNPDKEPQHHYGTTSYGAMELDFASYNQNNTVSFQDNNLNFNGGVSLTLGLQQHGNNGGAGGGGVSLAFSSPSTASQGSMFYQRDHHHHQHQHHDQDQHEIEPVVQYTMMDGEAQNNNLPYRNLMGAQLLHDLAG